MSDSLPMRKNLSFACNDALALTRIIEAILSGEDTNSLDAQKSCLDFLYKRIGKEIDNAYKVPSYQDLLNTIHDQKREVRELSKELRAKLETIDHLNSALSDYESKNEPENDDD